MSKSCKSCVSRDKHRAYCHYYGRKIVNPKGGCGKYAKTK
jgi:hypothetical protein